MCPYDPNQDDYRRADGGSMPSMSAPAPMPGKPAASYAKPQQPASQTDWQSAQHQSGWAQQQYQGSQNCMPPPQQRYQQARPSQGIPGGQVPPQQFGWQQGYIPQPPQQGYDQYQQPTGRGWSQPYPQQPQGSSWQGGYNAAQWLPNGYTPDYQPPVEEKPAGGGTGGFKLPPRMLAAIIAAAAVLVLILVLVGNSIGRQNEVKAMEQAVALYDDRYCEGVYVDGIHLGGMTREEAREAVQAKAQLKCDEWNVALVTSTGEYVGEINSYHLGMTVHVDGALNDAWAQGHTGTTADRKAAMDTLQVTPYYGSTALPSGDTQAIDRVLGEIARIVYVAPKDAVAHFNPLYTNPFQIEEEVVGCELDVTSIKGQVYDMVARMESGTIVLQTKPIYPQYTKADLESVTTLISTHYTPISTTSTEERNLNIKRACELINGYVVMPGESFSFNGVVGARSKKNGFHLATVYNYGKEEPGYGGGVCQVSSTIYVAAVRANLEITKRSQHGLVVGYTDLGLDATVNYDGRKIDFAFRNNTSSPIYIITKVMRKPKIDKSRDLVICEIYGAAMEPGVTYDLVATQTEVPIPEPTIVPDKEAAYVIYVDDPPYTEPGRIGYEVDSYKVKYVNGQEVERTHMYHDSYPAVQPITYVGVNERPITTDAPW
ncbi:MAG: VanW family protein [Clostridia bacterium]|nr:VanW family protein [Clostridia bacterium]